VYNHQIFNTTEQFVQAWKDKALDRLPPRPDNADDSWSTRARPPGAKQRDLDHLPGPRSVSFAGVRFRLDRATQYVSWMGWGMFFGFDRDMGLSLWDVRFRGERIIYEVRAAPAAHVGRR
jgi:primary-amine oxidase